MRRLLTVWLVISTASLDRVFGALSSPARRRMLDILQEHPGITIAELSKRFRMSGVGVLKHVKLLERAKLIVSRKEGRVRRLYFNAVPIQQIYDRWTDRYSSFWAARMADIKDRIENSLGLPEQSTDAAPAIGASPLTRSRQSA